MEMLRGIDQKRKEPFYMEMSRDNGQKNSYLSNELQLQNHSLSFIHKTKSLPSTTLLLSRSPIAYNTTASLEKLTCTDYVDFDINQDRFGKVSWSKNDSNYLDVKLKVFKKSDNKELQLVQILKMGETKFNQFLRLRNQLENTVENFAGEETLSPVMIPTITKDMDEHLKLAHKRVDVVDQPNRKNCVTLLRYNVDKPESSFAEVLLFARKKKDEKFEQIVYLK